MWCRISDMIYEMVRGISERNLFLAGKKDFESLHTYLNPVGRLIDFAKYLENASGKNVVEERLVEKGDSEFTLTIGICFRKWVVDEDFVEVDAEEYLGDEVLVTWRCESRHKPLKDNDAEIIVNVKIDGDREQDLMWRVLVVGEKLRGKPSQVMINFGFVGRVEEIRKGENIASVLARACVEQIEPALNEWKKRL